MNIRTTSLADLESINDLLAICYPILMKDAYSSETLASAIPILSKARPELLSSGTYFLATSSKDDIIGCGGWTVYSPINKENIKSDTGHIRHFATHPDYTKLGVGRSIFDACKAQASDHSIKQFECFSTLNAEGFYKSLGFSTSEKLEIPLTNGISFPCLLMKYTL